MVFNFLSKMTQVKRVSKVVKLSLQIRGIADSNIQAQLILPDKINRLRRYCSLGFKLTTLCEE